MDEFSAGGGVLGKDPLKRNLTASGTEEGGILSEGILHGRHTPGYNNNKKAMTLEEAMGDIKPLELSPELTLIKEKELTGAKVIDGKAIAK